MTITYLSFITFLICYLSFIGLYGQFQFRYQLPDDLLITKSTSDLRDLCESFPAFDGRFRFLGNTAEAYYLVQKGFIFFEYWFPQLMFTAIAVSNQTNNGTNTGCLTCYDYQNPNADPLYCLSECVGNNEFVITGQSDPTQDPLDRWKIWEIDFKDNGMFVSCQSNL